tara:strand:+ start:131 stop:829 length:699 start_codon:yes stop_codon:yes gene_type:complete
MKNTEVKVSKWLQDALPELQKRVFGPAKLEIPKRLRLNVGMMPGKAGAKNRTLGVCYKARVNNGVNLITLNIASPDAMETSERILDILCHEIIHAIDDCENGHGPVFKKMAEAIGLKGPMRSTTATPELTKTLAKVVKSIGAFPEKPITLTQRQDKNRMLKLICEGTEDIVCNHIIRASAQQIENIELNSCLCCGEGEYEVELSKAEGSRRMSVERFKYQQNMMIIEQGGNA